MAAQYPACTGGAAALTDTATAVQSQSAGSPTDVRIHPGRPQNPDVPDGDGRRGGGRLDGQRHADLGSVRSTETPVHVLQAEFRSSDESADRSDPRGDRHEFGLDY